MAVVKATLFHRDRVFCLLIDAEADTIEVVTDAGFHADTPAGSGVATPDFVPAHYQEVQAPRVGYALLRIANEPKRPVGLLVEHVSKRPRRLGRRPSPLWLVQEVVELAHSFPAQDEALFEPPLRGMDRGVLKRQNGSFTFVRAQ